MGLPFVIRDATLTAGREAESGLALMTEDEFVAFYERTARPLWAYLSRITGSAHEADDALQEAYYRFYRAGARHESESHRRHSLFQIATNLVRDAARRGKRHREVALEDDASATSPLRSHAPIAEHEVAVRTDLARAMKRLDPMQREMLWLAYAQGASHEEIAQLLGLRAISIRTLLLRARRKLAEFLAEGSGTRAQEVTR